MLLLACCSRFHSKFTQTKDFCKAILSISSTACQVLTRCKLSGVKLGCTKAQRLITRSASDDNTSWTYNSNKQYKMAAGRNSPRVNGMERAPKPFIIGVAGGTASGKSSVCAKIMEELGQSSMECQHSQVVIISQDAFYRNLTETEKLMAQKGEFNFDHPDAFDSDLMISTVKDIRAGRRVLIPTYSYINNAREDIAREVGPADVVLFEGILVFYFKEIRDMFNMKLFVDTDPDTRLSRRVLRDIQDRGRDLEQILHQYTSLVKPAFEEFCLPTKKYADVIIPRGADNVVAIDLIVQHIQEILHSQPVRRQRHHSDSFAGRPH